MSRRRRRERHARWAARIATVLWVVGAGWFMVAGYRGPYDYSQAYGGCLGSFRERANCTTANVLADDNRMFLNGAIKIAIVVVPAIGLYRGVLALTRPRRRLHRHSPV